MNPRKLSDLQPVPPPGERLVAPSELRSARASAALLGVTTSTLTRWSQHGVITPLIRDPLVYHLDDVKKLKANLDVWRRAGLGHAGGRR